MQLLEPILHIPALTVDRIDPGRRVIKIGHDEAGIALGVVSRQPDDLSFDDHAAAVGPTPSGVARVAIVR
jgi:hypothetical protein